MAVDRFGHGVHLWERDCSVQRRHQKILEESPSPALSAAGRRSSAERAIRAVVAAGYENVGTLEFLVDGDGNAYFIEINCRIQVEHPVTEMLTGIDLVATQIRIAAGEPLGFTQADVPPARPRDRVPDQRRGSRARLPAGRRHHRALQRARADPGVRFDSHAYAGYEVPPYYDSLLGKLVVWGRTRDDAIARGRAALERARRGRASSPTPRSTGRCSPSEPFLDGRMTTNLLDRIGSAAFLAGGGAILMPTPAAPRSTACARQMHACMRHDASRPRRLRAACDRPRSHARHATEPAATAAAAVRAHDARDRGPHPAPLAVPARRPDRGLRPGREADRGHQGRDRHRVVLPGPLPGPAGRCRASSRSRRSPRRWRVYVAKQPGFGDRIGLFAGIDEVRFKRIVMPGRHAPARGHHGEARQPLRQGPRRRAAWTARWPARACSASSSRRPGSSDDAGSRSCPTSTATSSRSRRRWPRSGRRSRTRSSWPAISRSTGRSRAAAIDALRALEARGRADRLRQHGHRRRRLRLRRGLPVVRGRRPGRHPHRRRVGARRAGSDEQLDWLRRLPAERRSARSRRHPRPGRARVARLADARLRPGPGRQRDLRARVGRTDARVICVGHTHLPEVRDLGWKVIVNAGSAGYVFDGDPTASWALVTIDDGEVAGRDPAHRVRRAGRRQRDLGAWPAGRRLPCRHRPHREAGPMTWAWPGSTAPASSCTGMGAVTALGNDVASTWAGLVAGRSGIDRVSLFDPSRLDSQIAARGQGLRSVGHPGPQGDAPHGPVHPVRAGLRAPGDGRRRASRTSRRRASPPARASIIGSGLGGVQTLFDNVAADGPAGPGPDLAVLRSRWASRTSAPARSPSLRRARPQLRHRLGVRHRRSRDRRGLGDDPPR